MAGFGIFMEFLALTLTGLLIATIVAFLLWFFGKTYISDEVAAPVRQRFLRACRIAPFAGLLWILFVFVLYSYTNDWFFHRDDSMSTNPHAPLPNGYIVGSVDYHEGYILGPGHQMSGFPHNGDDRLAQVLNMKVTKSYIIGNQFVWPTVNISYFIWDLQTGEQYHFGSQIEFRLAAAERGIQIGTIPNETWVSTDEQLANNGQGTRVDLVSYWDFYQKYRHTWFDNLAVMFAIAGQLVILILLIKWGRQLRIDALRTEPLAGCSTSQS
jgi:hypothetical protein